MNLKSIKLAGFKSFVDPTLIPIESFLTGIVGPNGCGKSNVVDAIRWVIGESSAKQLRGQSMADVIFNGAGMRKPVGRASVELIFDNCAGRLSGELGRFNEVSVRREVLREGHTRYFLNGTVCRRRDVVDVFLGTGVGARSYSIIEQGVISELIEAKPEELRLHLEEVSGISKYRERRRETENRMQHTKENLERINDINEELTKQLRHLKRQADAAERYSELKQEERQLQATLKGLQWRSAEEQLLVQKQQLGHLQTDDEGLTAELREIETKLERDREEEHVITQETNQVQKEYYEIGADIARLEQQIQNRQERFQYIQKELEKLNVSRQEFEKHIADQHQRVADLNLEQQNLQPQLTAKKQEAEQSSENLKESEQKMKDWQNKWESLQQELSDLVKQVSILRVNLQHYKRQLESLLTRRELIQSQLNEMPLTSLNQEMEPLAKETSELNDELESLKNILSHLTLRIADHRQQIQSLQATLEGQKNRHQETKSRHFSLEVVQKNALGYQNNQIKAWLEKNSIMTQPRLGEILKVKQGWEIAVETVLSNLFEAICLEDLEKIVNSLPEFDKGNLTILANKHFVNQTKTDQNLDLLSSQVESDWPVHIWLDNIYLAQNFTEAVSRREQLAEHESIITPEGIWMSKNWIRVNKGKNEAGSVLLREQELKQLSQQISLHEEEVQKTQNTLQQQLGQLKVDEEARDNYHQTYQKVSAALADSRSKLSAGQSRLTELKQQSQRLQKEYEEISQQIDPLQVLIEESLQQFSELHQEEENKNTIKLKVTVEGEEIRQGLEQIKRKAEHERHQADEVSMRLRTIENQMVVIKQNVLREENQLQQLKEKYKALTAELDEAGSPLNDFQIELQNKLNMRLEVEKQLKISESKLDACNQHVAQLNKNHHLINEKREKVKQAFQNLQLEYQTLRTRQTTIEEQLADQNVSLEQLLPTLPSENNSVEIQAHLESINTRLQRLGAINLAAVEEYKTVSERKDYLDKQQADLNEALEILKSAINKIDRETRTKFEETFQKVDQNFQELFPRIFGGGKAFLELTDPEWLTAGVLVKAQPPGKRNATIHMLSGGEKALTAVALVFALFRLNPAPFCVLDEVDAPLDDINVGRFCNLVKEMSKTTQFIIISHNKVTISMAEHLMGVTMQEAGVSRIVSVNVAEAVSLATT